jgi:hypothetical protein
MTKGMTIKRAFVVGRGQSNLRQQREKTPGATTGRIPRIARLMALAVHFDKLMHDGLVVDQAALARFAKISRARVTQIMNLNNLAPQIQHEILFCDRAIDGPSPVSERSIRPIVSKSDWAEQNDLWCKIHTGRSL